MKKKLLAIVLTVVMVLAGTVTAFAAENDGTITVENAAAGETYKVYKLFDATVSETGSVAYTSNADIPAALTQYFTKDSAGNISEVALTNESPLTEAERADAFKAWADAQPDSAIVAEATASGGAVQFTGLEYGYYVVTSTQGGGAKVSVTSVSKNGVIRDKNQTTITAQKKVNGKDEDNVSVGDTVTYTATFATANYVDDEKVTGYKISDTLPDFLSDVEIKSVTVSPKVDGATATINPVPEFENKAFTLDWVDASGNHLYKNGAVITVTYTAKVTSAAEVDGTAGNVNTVSIQPCKGPNKEPYSEPESDNAKIFTYAAAIKKVDENGNPLAGAEFAIKGLTVTGANGNYTVVSYDADSEENGTTMVCDDNGVIIIRGIKEEVVLTVTEMKAPDGYNMLTAPKTLTVQKVGEVVTATTTTKYYDEDGNLVNEETETSKTEIEYTSALEPKALVVENKKGTEMPSTGGMGTTILYTLGGLLVVGAGVLLVARRKMDN